MKKALALVLALTMVFALVACGGGNSGGSSASGETLKIFNSKMEIQSQMEEMAAEYSKAKGVNVEVYYSSDTVAAHMATRYASNEPYALAMVDAKDVYSLGAEHAVDLSGEKWVGACCPEIESCPRTFACRTAQGLILEAFENLALGMDFISMFAADARTDETTDFYADGLFPRLAAAHAFLKGYHSANAGTRPCGFSVPGGLPARLVACRGVPIVGATGRSLGPLPDVASIKVRMSGSGEVDRSSPGYQTRVMQIASSTGLTNFYARCDFASGGRLPVVFGSAVRAFVMPCVRDDWTLTTVALVNASIDRQDPVTVRLRGVPADAKAAVWRQPEAEDAEIALVRDGDGVRVRLPRIGAWECGYLSFK